MGGGFIASVHRCRNQFLDAFGGQLYPIIAIVGLSFFIGIGSWFMRIFGKGKIGKEVSAALATPPPLRNPPWA